VRQVFGFLKRLQSVGRFNKTLKCFLLAHMTHYNINVGCFLGTSNGLLQLQQ